MKEGERVIVEASLDHSYLPLSNVEQVNWLENGFRSGNLFRGKLLNVRFGCLSLFMPPSKNNLFIFTKGPPYLKNVERK